jgi:hypothetical protein
MQRNCTLGCQLYDMHILWVPVWLLLFLQRLEQSRAVTSEDLRKQRVANAATVEAMAKQYAGQQR